MQSRNELEEITLQFFHQVQNRTSWEDMQRFYHPNIQQIEYPNAITKVTAIRTLSDLQAASERGQKVLQKEEYEVVKLYCSHNTVIAEAIWTGTLAIPIGSLAVGDKMTAHFAQFFEYEKDEEDPDKRYKIIRQRNYDCFNPF